MLYKWMWKKIKRAVENNDNVKGINVILLFFERRINICISKLSRINKNVKEKQN
jgi:hypothetical protein